MLALRNDPIVTADSNDEHRGLISDQLEEVVVTTGRVRGVVTVMSPQDLTIPNGLGGGAEDGILRDLPAHHGSSSRRVRSWTRRRLNSRGRTRRP